MSDNYSTLFLIDTIEALVNKNPQRGLDASLEKTDLFQARSYGINWSLEVGFVKQSDYTSREAFEEEFIEMDRRDDSNLDPEVDNISIREAFDRMRIFVRMREGLCENEEEAEDERFNLEMIKILGENETDEVDEKTSYKICKINKFRLLSKDGNCYYATAIRGAKYLFFLSYN